MSTFEKVKEYFETINLQRYDLGGCEFQDDDFETIAERVDAGKGAIEKVTDDYLYEVREILDEGLEDIEEQIKCEFREGNSNVDPVHQFIWWIGVSARCLKKGCFI